VDEHTGAVVGTTFFWGTIGSIVGSLLSGFLFIPLLGVEQSIVGTGIVLVVLGISGRLLLGALPQGEPPIHIYVVIKRHGKFIALFILLTLILYSLINPTTMLVNRTVLYETDGLYSHILVYEATHAKGTLRALKRDANNSSATLLDSHDLIFGYSQFAEFYPRLLEETGHFLLIGGGAYSMPRTLVARDSEIVVDVVEIEPSLFEIAQEYFDVNDTERINNFVMDGRVFLARSEKQYDVIFGDAFGTDLSVPAHLTTKEFLEEVRTSLTPDGIYMLNYIGSLEIDAPTLTGSLVKTLSSVFPNLKMYAFNKPNPQSTQNVVFVARNGDVRIDFGGQTVAATGGQTYLVSELEVPISRFDLDNELLLTDDRAPVEYLMAKQL
jgi:spermidine synthase